jgi:hypothetical protein
MLIVLFRNARVGRSTLVKERIPCHAFFFGPLRWLCYPLRFYCVVNTFQGFRLLSAPFFIIDLGFTTLSRRHALLLVCLSITLFLPHSEKRWLIANNVTSDCENHTPAPWQSRCSVTIKLLLLTMALLGRHLSPPHQCPRRNPSGPTQCLVTDTCS